MTIQQFLKGIFMALIAVAVTFFSQTPINYGLMVVTAIAVVLSYIGKNLISVWHSDSLPGTFSLINFASALLVALATGITEAIVLIVIEGKVIWLVLVKVVLSVTFTYIATTLFAPQNNKSKKLFV